MKARILIAVVVSALAGCAGNDKVWQPGEKVEESGFQALKFPSNSLSPGQIVEIGSTIRTGVVELVHNTSIPVNQIITSPGWNTSAVELSTAEGTLGLNILKVVQASGKAISGYTVTTKFADTETKLIPKEEIFKALNNDLSSDVSLKRLIQDYKEEGSSFGVITETLTATVEFSLVDANNQTVQFDADIINSINSKLNLGLERTRGNSKTIYGKGLVIGIKYDTKMVNLILRDIRIGLVPKRS